MVTVWIMILESVSKVVVLRVLKEFIQTSQREFPMEMSPDGFCAGDVAYTLYCIIGWVCAVESTEVIDHFLKEVVFDFGDVGWQLVGEGAVYYLVWRLRVLLRVFSECGVDRLDNFFYCYCSIFHLSPHSVLGNRKPTPLVN